MAIREKLTRFFLDVAFWIDRESFDDIICRDYEYGYCEDCDQRMPDERWCR